MVVAVSKLTLILLSGGIALVSAAVGSAVSGWVVLRAEDKRFERQIRADDRAARAAARLVHEDLAMHEQH